MTTQGNSVASARMLQDIYVRADRFGVHASRARNAQLALGFIALVALAFMCFSTGKIGNSWNIVKITCTCTGAGLFSAAVTGMIISKLVTRIFKNQRDVVKAQVKGEWLYNAFLATPQGNWADQVGRLSPQAWTDWIRTADAKLASQETVTEAEEALLRFFVQNRLHLIDNLFFISPRFMDHLLQSMEPCQKTSFKKGIVYAVEHFLRLSGSSDGEERSGNALATFPFTAVLLSTFASIPPQTTFQASGKERRQWNRECKNFLQSRMLPLIEHLSKQEADSRLEDFVNSAKKIFRMK